MRVRVRLRLRVRVRAPCTSVTSRQGAAAPDLTLTPTLPPTLTLILTLTLTLTLTLIPTLTLTLTLTRLHSEHPGAEPGEQEPLLLSDVQQDTLPGPPPPYRPDSKDQPALRHFIYLGALPPTQEAPLTLTLTLTLTLSITLTITLPLTRCPSSRETHPGRGPSPRRVVRHGT